MCSFKLPGVNYLVVNAKRINYFIFFLLISFAVHFLALKNPFLQDDLHSITNNPSVTTSLDRIDDYFIDPNMFSSQPDTAMYRPLLLVSYAFNCAISSLLSKDPFDPLGFRLVNLLLLVINAWLVVKVLNALGANKQVALFTGLLFLLNPLQTQTLNLISARSALLGTSIALVALLFHLKSRTIVSAILYGIALLAAEAPSVFLIILLISSIASGKDFKKSLIRIIPHAIILALYLVLRKTMFGSPLGEDYVRGVWVNLITQMKVFWFSFRLYLWPNGLNIYHGISVENSILSATAIISTIGFLAVVAVGLLLLFRSKQKLGRMDGFFMLWPAIALVPYMLIPLNIILNEHHLHVVIIAPSYLLARLICRSSTLRLRPEGVESLENIRGSGREKLSILLLVVICVAWSSLAIKRDSVYAGNETVFRDSIRKSPDNARPYLELGSTLYWQERYAEAERHLKTSLEKDPNLLEAYLNLGIVHYYQVGRQRDAAIQLETYIRLKGKALKSGQPHLILGIIALNNNKPLLAGAMFEKSILINPSKDNPAWKYRGRL